MKKQTIRTHILVILLIISSFAYSQTGENNVLNQKDTRPISTILADNNDLPIEDRIEIYKDLKSTRGIERDLEETMNMYGYGLMWSGKNKEAIEIFKLIATDFPNSANAYDSLAEAYLNDDQKDKALINYKIAVTMDSNNYNALDQIEKIQNPNLKKLTPQEKFSKKYKKNEYYDDLDQLASTLLDIHPNALKFISNDDFSQLIAKKKSEINNETTFAQFSWICNEIIANINCSHTNASRFWNENQMLPNAKRFPLETRIIDNKLYVTNSFSNREYINIKDQITYINGISADSIINEVYNHISSQGYIKTSKRHEFNKFSTGMVAYALGLPDSYEVRINDSNTYIKLKTSEENNDPQRDRSKVYCGDNLCFDFLDTENKIAIMTISSFNYYEWNNLDVFKRFVDESMNQLKESNTQKLIIDLRGNGGGSPESSIHLLRYLLKDDFAYYSKVEFDGKIEPSYGEKAIIPIDNGFDGNLYFIIDGEGNSTTGHFMSLVKKYKLGKIIGEELGSNQFCSAGQMRSRLSNTKLEYSIANNTHVTTATNLPDDIGILPDHRVIQSIDDFILGKDIVREYAINYATKDMKWTPSSGHHSSYFLDTPQNWQKELFRIPLNFATDMTLKGIEDARFPNEWRTIGSNTFWSYVFAWNIKHQKMITIDEIETNLEMYFNGLMRIKERGEEAGIRESIAKFQMKNSTENTSTFIGTIHTLDGFFEQKPITFNVKADQQYCPELGRTIIKFQFSPQPFDSDTWEILSRPTIVENICDK